MNIPTPPPTAPQVMSGDVSKAWKFITDYDDCMTASEGVNALASEFTAIRAEAEAKERERIIKIIRNMEDDNYIWWVGIEDAVAAIRLPTAPASTPATEGE